jgi:hypothetical protein
MYCLCVNVYCHRVTTRLQLINISYHVKICRPALRLSCFSSVLQYKCWNNISALNYAMAASPVQLVYLIVIRRSIILVVEDIVKQLRK